jgi:hypothetical protein
MPNPSRSPSAKLLEIKALVEVARSSLLDAVVMVNELYEVLAATEVSTTDDRFVRGLESNETQGRCP